LTARCDRSDKYTIADLIPGHACAQFLDHSNGFVTDHETRRNRIFTSDDVKIGSANRGERHAYDCFAHAGSRFIYLFNPDVVLTVKYICFHFDHHFLVYFSMQCGHQAIESVVDPAQT
jgi:hypothetical protein